MKHFCLFFILISYNLSAQEIIKDIAQSNKSIVIESTCTVGNSFYISAKNLETGIKSLWFTDGQTSGTIELINTGQPNAPTSFERMTEWNGKLFFASGNQYHRDLWVSDGTINGTIKFKSDIGTFAQGDFGKFYKGQNYLFFISQKDDYDTNGIDLWRTDGTTAGTLYLKSLYTSSEVEPTFLDIEGIFYFISFTDNSSNRTEQLWSTDGNTFTYLANLTSEPRYYASQRFIKLGSQLIVEHFKVTSSGYTNIIELWKSNGTIAGTVKYTEYDAGYRSTSNFREYLEINGVLYFNGSDTNKGELWRTDGTQYGTYAISNFAANGDNTDPRGFNNINNQLIALGNIEYQSRLFRVGASNYAEKIIIPNNLYYSTASYFAKLNNQLYFTIGDNIWQTDGVNSSLFYAHNSNYSVYKYHTANNKLFFTGKNSLNQEKLFVCDGTIAVDLSIYQSQSSFVFQKILGQTSNIIFFLAYDDIHGYEIWRTDGTQFGTFLLKDINTEKASSSPKKIISVGNKIFYTARNEKTGTELWETDAYTLNTSIHYEFTTDTTQNFNGLASFNGKGYVMTNGTELWEIRNTGVYKIQSESRESTYPANFTISNNRLFFTFKDIFGVELWSLIGTYAYKVKTIYIYTGSSPKFLTDVNGTLFFSAKSEYSGDELWKSNGESSGTVKVKEITSGSASTIFNYLFNANGTLLFITDNGKKLWKSNGTDAGTVILKNFGSGIIYNNFVNYHGFTYFVANDPIIGEGLYRTDGNNIEFIKPLALNLSSQNSFEIVVFKDFIFFIANNTLWKTDGTNIGTNVFSSISCSGLLSTTDNLFFKGCDTNGCELWSSDNVQTQMLKDINVGSGSSNPNNLSFINDKLYFSANDGINGEELWYYTNCPNERTLSETYLTGVTKKLEAANSITTTNLIENGANIKHDAGKYIILNPGFKVINGGVYKAYINGCATDNN
ncbi:3-coathanger stack domain-containing protein [Emticicia sp. SJ17W-69]|uniref:3-coathanger stack domain-containing protein n=1 Tax=Emticicia sp. SJ17W-69 TaxID=3421657 RepID=UPI003EB8019F